MASRGPLTGSTLGRRYDVLDALGTGGMGTVYRAHDRELDETVALKVIRDDLAAVSTLVDRFRAEVRLARRVTHRNVARTFELGSSDGVTFFTMELIDGESLSRRLARPPRLEVQEAATIACVLCEALDAAHAAGVIHRDLKPDNVLLARDGRVVLTDFGVATLRSDGEEFGGTPRYAAPEQVRGEAPTPAADLYALGLILFEMLTGRPGFPGEPLAVFEAKLAGAELERRAGDLDDPDLDALVTRVTSSDPARRPASALELGAALGRWSDRRTPRPALLLPRRERVVLPTIVVHAPTVAGDAPPHLIEGFHPELLAHLAVQPGLRLVPRATSGELGDVQVELTAIDEDVVVRATRVGAAPTWVELRMPLEPTRLATDAVIAANAVLALTTPAPAARPALPAEAHDLMLRARYLSQRDRSALVEAMALYERAEAIAPGDPRIAAGIAIARIRRAFFARSSAESDLAKAEVAARAALEADPHLAEAHLAYGHLELHRGDAVAAAARFRTAIACAPYLAEAHAWLGSMLLEAGYLEAGASRLTDAESIMPQFAPRWDLVRVYALEGRWAEVETESAALLATPGAGQRWTLRARMATWRRDDAAIAAMKQELEGMDDVAFERRLMIELCEVAATRSWGELRAGVVARLDEAAVADVRRRAFVAQIVAELAGWVGDAELGIAAVSSAVGAGLFDLLWLDRCPAIASLRADPRFCALRAPVKERADGIHDALRGEGLDPTVASTAWAPAPARGSS